MAWPALIARTKNWGTEILTDSDLEGQFDLIIDYINDMMNSTSGHKHDATTAEGPKILINDLTIASRAQGDIYYDNGTNPTRLAAGTSGQFLKTQGAGANPVWAAVVDGTTHPTFSAQRSATQSVNGSTFTKIQFDTEDFDTATAYDNATNYRFTPQVAGKYMVTVGLEFGAMADGNEIYAYIYRNGSAWKATRVICAAATGHSACVTAIVDLNGSTDYVEAYGYQSNAGAKNVVNNERTFFCAARVA